MTPPSIPIVRVRGSHREVGEAVRRFAAAPFDRELIECYRAVTLERLPWVVEELDGVADAAGVEQIAVFAASVEELEPAAAPTGCSDLVVTGEHRRARPRPLRRRRGSCRGRTRPPYPRRG